MNQSEKAILWITLIVIIVAIVKIVAMGGFRAVSPGASITGNAVLSSNMGIKDETRAGGSPWDSLDKDQSVFSSEKKLCFVDNNFYNADYAKCKSDCALIRQVARENVDCVWDYNGKDLKI